MIALAVGLVTAGLPGSDVRTVKGTASETGPSFPCWSFA